MLGFVRNCKHAFKHLHTHANTHTRPVTVRRKRACAAAVSVAVYVNGFIALRDAQVSGGTHAEG